jgi:hypothetical protein
MIKRTIFVANASASLQTILTAEAHLAEGQFLLENQAMTRDIPTMNWKTKSFQGTEFRTKLKVNFI